MKCTICAGPVWASRDYPTGPKQWHHTMRSDNDHDPEVK